MKAPAVAMAATSDVHWSVRADAVKRRYGQWWLSGNGFAPEAFGRAVIALPSEQAAVLLAP